MPIIDYVCTRFDGEYCYLTDKKTKNEIFIAISLLPQNIDVGTELRFENFEYSIIK